MLPACSPVRAAFAHSLQALASIETSSFMDVAAIHVERKSCLTLTLLRSQLRQEEDVRRVVAVDTCCEREQRIERIA